MSLLCAASHMESSQCVWRRWQKTSTAMATATERVAAVFWFLLSAMAMTNKHTLSQQSFVQFLRFLPVPVILHLSSAHTISFVLLPHTPHTPMLAFSLPLLSLAFRSSLSRQFARFTLLLSALSLCLVGVLFIHVFSTYLWHSYSHCTTTVCVSFYPCACALCPCLCVDSPCCCYCWRPWLKSRSPAFAYHITPCSFSFSCFIYAQACVCVSVWKVESELYFCFLWLLRCTLSTFSLEDNTPRTLRAFSSLLSFSFCFFYKG